MKVNNHFGRWIILCLTVWTLCCGGANAQSLPLHDNERVDYELYFKWGLIMSRAGMATLSVQDEPFREQPGWHYSLLFRTTGVIEKVYRMRDTMDCHYSKEPKLFFCSKRTNEGNYYSVDNLDFRYGSEKEVAIHSLRYNLNTTKIDTTILSREPVFDMLGSTMYLRSLDWPQMMMGDEFPFVCAVGRDLVNIRFRYTGQEIVEHKDANYRTRHFVIDIYDEAFSQAKEAAEVWIGDDDNHIPVKIRAKLKIGAAEVHYKESFNLRYPLTCRIVLPK